MNKTAKYVIWVVVIIVAVWAIYVLSNKQGAGPATGESIKIGFIGPLTGEGASIGTVNKVGAEVAVDEINKAGGINGKPLEIIYEDGQCNAIKANTAAQKLIEVDKVPLIIGGLCSTETSAFAPGAMEKKVIVFSWGSSAPTLSKLGKYFFRDFPSDIYQGKFSAEYIFNNLKAKKVAILYHNTDMGLGQKEAFEKRFKELGGEILGTESAVQAAKDYRTQLTKIKNLNPDVIFSPMYPDGAIVALKQASELGIKTTFFGGDAWGDTKLHKEVSGKGNFLFSEPSAPIAADFKAKILAITKGEQVPPFTSQIYDAVKIAAAALTKAGIDPDKLQEEIRKTNYNGVSGQISFDENGDLKTANYVVKKIENGTAVEVK